MSLLFDQERRLPPDTAQRLPTDPTRLPSDPTRLPMNNLGADSVGGVVALQPTPALRTLFPDNRHPAVTTATDFRPLPPSAAASTGGRSLATGQPLPSFLPTVAGPYTGNSVEPSSRLAAAVVPHMLDGPAQLMVEPIRPPLVPEPVIIASAPLLSEELASAGRPVPFLEEPQVCLGLR